MPILFTNSQHFYLWTKKVSGEEFYKMWIKNLWDFGDSYFRKESHFQEITVILFLFPSISYWVMQMHNKTCNVLYIFI